MVKIQTGSYEVLYSGTVIGLLNEPITFEFPSDKASLKIVINFTHDDTQNEPHLKLNLLGATALEILFINFANSLGSGNTNPLEIGYLENRKLFFNYRVYAIKDISNTLHYTFYLGEEGSHVTI